jgi:GT2 family glycosyltransferase
MSKRTRVKLKSLVDIIIPVHGRMDLLRKCLRALPKAMSGIPYSVIIVDNATPDDKKDKNLYTSLKANPLYFVIENQTNTGFPKACNQGVRKGRSPLIFFLNSDVILEPNSINRLVTELDDPKMGVVGMKLVFPSEGELLDIGINPEIRPEHKIQHIGLSTNIRGEFIHAYVGWDANHPKVNKVRDMYAVTGAALMTRRNLYRKAGGFNEQYGLGTYEDVEYCLTVRDMGYNIVVVPEACGVHYTGATSESYQIGYPIQTNKMLFMSKWANKLNYTEHGTW